MIVSLGLLISCSGLKNAPESKARTEPQPPLSVQMDSTYKTGETIRLSINNNHPENVLKIYHPLELNIEKKTTEGWKEVDILYCRCGASCPPPPEYREIRPEQAYRISWDQKTSWCGDLKENGIREYHEKQVSTGKYRIILRFQFENKEIHSIQKYFNIVN